MIEPAIETADAQQWRRIRTAFVAWRGELATEFARVEYEVTETLIACKLAGSELMIGQRYARLAEAVATGGSLSEYGHARGALACFQKHHELRNAICHGATQITIDEQGQWVAILRMIRLRGGVAERSVEVVSQADAAEQLAAVKASGASLTGQLKRMCRLVAAKPQRPVQALGDKAETLLMPHA